MERIGFILLMTVFIIAGYAELTPRGYQTNCLPSRVSAADREEELSMQDPSASADHDSLPLFIHTSIPLKDMANTVFFPDAKVGDHILDLTVDQMDYQEQMEAGEWVIKHVYVLFSGETVLQADYLYIPEGRSMCFFHSSQNPTLPTWDNDLFFNSGLNLNDVHGLLNSELKKYPGDQIMLFSRQFIVDQLRITYYPDIMGIHAANLIDIQAFTLQQVLSQEELGTLLSP